MTSHEGDNLPEKAQAEADPIADPGLPDHVWRPTDVDQASEKRAERQIATLFGLSAVCAVLFVVSYFTLEIGEVTTTFAGLGASTLALGLTLSGALLFIGIGVIQWARKLMSDHEIVEMRHPIASSDEDREETMAMVATGVEESGIGRRPLVRNSLLGALGVLALPVPVVLLRDLGPAARQRALHDRLDRRACACAATWSAPPSRPPSSRSATSSTPSRPRCSRPTTRVSRWSRASTSRS